MKTFLFFLLAVSLLCMSNAPRKTTLKAPIFELTKQGKGALFGYIEVKKRKDGIAIHVVASGLKPGNYGFHMHEKNSVFPTTDADGKQVIGGGLGGHWDPDHTNRHAGPEGDGHRGDLPMLHVNAKGRIDQTVVSKRIPFDAVEGKSFVIHAMPDNYTDHPTNGGSGARAYAAVF